ncbi:MAG: caspase family protein [Phormidesmis sp. RL_2_1]|nr:caspase family protein [Phormidesmis sp. RL_2_1]
MGLSRRALLKQTGAVVAALGLTDLAMTGLNTKAKAYGQALANSSGRKLALLVGIDKYAAGALPPDQSSQIAGAATDVAMQKALLIYRFGFLPKDILCLTNEQATRTGIYQAFVDHLYEQAKPGDAVVFHFSGYGAQVRVADLQGGQSTVRSLVPHDGLLPSETRPALNDLSEIELKTLLKLLKTKNVTTVLDAGFVDLSVPLSGGLRSRTRSAIATGLPPAPFPLLTKPASSTRERSFSGCAFARRSG